MLETKQISTYRTIFYPVLTRKLSFTGVVPDRNMRNVDLLLSDEVELKLNEVGVH